MADRFCLVSLPKEKALKVLDMVSNDKSLPHMHQDSKVTVEYSERTRVEKSVRNNLHKDEKRNYRKGSEINPKTSGDKGKSHARARVHTGTKRNSKAAIYKKSANAVEF